MGEYGHEALEAVQLLKNHRVKCTQTAWENATALRFGKGSSSQNKSCHGMLSRLL
jgi:hypothetical protein